MSAVVSTAEQKMIPRAAFARSPRGTRASWPMDKLKVAFDRGKVAARLIGLPQCERVLLCHVHVIADRAYSIVTPFGRTPLGAAPGRMLGKAPSVFTKTQLFFPHLMPPANKPGK